MFLSLGKVLEVKGNSNPSSMGKEIVLASLKK